MDYFNMLHDDWLIFVQMITAGVFGAWLAWTLWYVNEEKRRYAADLPQKLKDGMRARLTILGVLILIGVAIGIGAALLVLTAEWDRAWATLAAITISMAPGRLAKFPVRGATS